MPDIRIEHVSYSYDGLPVLRDITLSISSGEFFSLLGPNGSGKTTLLRLVSSFYRPDAGEVYVDGKALRDYALGEIAKLIAVVPQSESIVFPFTVQEVVIMGRAPYLSGLGFEKKKDKEIARRAMRMTDIVHLAMRPVTELSGGEAHRVMIARALAQQTPILLLDEPTAHLDIKHQVELFDLLHSLNRENGLTILCVSHDINLAAQYSHRVALLSEGSFLAYGTPCDVITKENIFRAYQTYVDVDMTQQQKAPRVTLLRGDTATPDISYMSENTPR